MNNNLVLHTIRRGDTLYKLASAYRASIQDMLRDNPGIDPRSLCAGQVISIAPGPEFVQKKQRKTGSAAPPIAYVYDPTEEPPQPPQPPVPPKCRPECRERCKPECRDRCKPERRERCKPERRERCKPECEPTPKPAPRPVPRPPDCVTPKQKKLSDDMRLVWSQHVYWTRMTIISILECLRDEQANTARLLKNPADMAALLRPCYGDAAATAVEKLLTEHLMIAADLVRALRTGDTAAAQTLDTRWTQNADEIAAALSAVNPVLEKQMLQRMLYEHLDLTKQQATDRLARRYPSEVVVFDKIEVQAIGMADALTAGTVRQFPQMFS